MRRALRLVVASGLLVLAVATLATSGSAKQPSPGRPFYLVPSLTKECQNVKDCVGVPGPWIVVPARGEATYLFGCPARRAFIVGGTDARASSKSIRVWFDGKLGAPIGVPRGSKGGAILLFHATANNGKEGTFQPILGCVTPTQRSKRSTVAVLPGTPPGAPLDLRTEQFGLKLNRPLLKHTTTVGCPKNERLVGSWSALAFASTGPPDLAYAKAVTVTIVAAGGKVHADIEKSRVFGPFAPRAWAQIGAMCEP